MTALRLDEREGDASRLLIAACMIGFFVLSEIMPILAIRIGFGTQFGAALILAFAIIAFAIYLFESGFKWNLSWSYFPAVILFFTLYCFLTSSQALSPDRAFDTSKKLLVSWLTIFLLYESWNDRRSDVDTLLFCLMTANYLMMLFVAGSLGLNGLLNLLKTQERISNDNLNANTLGLCCSYGILINLYFIHKGKYRWFLPVVFLSILLLAVSQSRKGILVLVLGMLGYIILQCMQKDHIVLNTVKILIIVAALLALFFLLSHLSVFSGMMGRIEDMIVGFSETTSEDASFNTRIRMKEIGREIFEQHPLLGIGVDNSGLICGREFRVPYFYLHDNYIELLADTGIIGFAIYYSGYALMLFRFLRHWRFQDSEFNICLMLLILNLVFDYGMVTFLSKTTYFYALVIWSETEKIRSSKPGPLRNVSPSRYIRA